MTNKKYTIRCAETGDYIYTCQGDKRYSPFTPEELCGNMIGRLPIKFTNVNEATNFLFHTTWPVIINGVGYSISEYHYLFEIVEIEDD